MKIIGIRIYPRSKSVSRVLKPGWFPFGEYKEPKGDDLVVMPKYPQEIDKVYTTSYRPHISINAIVGQNGAGKSTLLDILFKIINNFVIRIIGKAKYDNEYRHLKYAYGVHADLYYEIDGQQRRINCRNTKIELYYMGKTQFEIHPYASKTEINEILGDFFYTIVTNYSLYAYNTQDYALEKGEDVPKDKDNGSWLTGLFHKNDGYYTPLVMTPFRSHGSIDVEKESYLAERRINTMALLAEANDKTFISNYRPTTLYISLNRNFIDEKTDALRKSIRKKDEWLDLHLTLELFKKRWTKYLCSNCGLSSTVKKIPQLEMSIFYLAYKSLKLSLYYPDYRRRFDIDSEHEGYYKDHESEFYEHCLPQKIDNIIENILRDRNEKEEEHNHLILKIDQTLDYLMIYIKTGLFPWKDSDQINVKSFLSGKKITRYCDLFRIMPPVFYNTQIEFTKTGEFITSSSWQSFDRPVMRLAMMSSGERHLLNCLSYVLYHIKNLESVKSDKERIKYRHICLVFDEVELYFHPDYQRRFIKMLLEALEWCNISNRNIKSIQLLIVTHSPFILTDVFTQNTIYLKEGKRVQVDGQTFGANYYDILNNSFFFEESAVGEISTNFIRGLVKSQHRVKARNLSEFIGDSMIRQYISNPTRIVNKDVSD